MIGAKRVAISRALGRLRAAGALEVKQLHIYLKDEEVLERIASEDKYPFSTSENPALFTRFA